MVKVAKKRVELKNLVFGPNNLAVNFNTGIQMMKQ